MSALTKLFLARRWYCLAASLLGALSAFAAPAVANDQVTLTIEAPALEAPERTDGAAAAHISVTGTQGRYERVTGDRLPVTLQLSAAITAEGAGHKILSSELFLKQAGSGNGARAANTLEGTVPVRSLSLSRTFDFAVEANGPVAQNAIAVCNDRAASERAHAQTLILTVPVLWRVTTGKFNFKWTNYDRVAPSEDIQNNPDFYAERETVEAEAAAHVAVVCQPLGAAIAAKSAPVKTRAAEPKAEPIPGQHLAAAPAAVSTASFAPSTKPECDGGMIRQVRASPEAYLCLCPGNTGRVETGANAYACERKIRLR